MTGFVHNAVTPVGVPPEVAARMPVVVSHHVAALPRFGSGLSRMITA